MNKKKNKFPLMAAAIAFSCIFWLNPLNAQTTDWRNIEEGWEIPSVSYSDQPYVVKTDDGAWLCVKTTGLGHEGEQGQHVISLRSFDQGKTWIDKREVESPEGVEASYAVLLKAPSGRVFVFYNYNTNNVRQVKADNPPYSTGHITRVDKVGDFVFRYSDDHGKTWSANHYPIPVRKFKIDRENAYKGEMTYFWNVGRGFEHEGSAYVPLTKIGGFGDGFFTSNEGVLLKSDNLLTIADPGRANWETLPDGDIGLRTPPGGGPIAAEHSYSILSDGSLYCVYRSIDGHPVFTYSRDGGYTWEPPQYKRYANGHLIKHPRAANFAWRCENGKYLYWFHNHGGKYSREHPNRPSMGYIDRNPVWISGGIEKDGPNGKIIEWTQPEILLYDDDPLIRMSYPDLIEDKGNYYMTETQKHIARVHKIDEPFLNQLWSQFHMNKRTTDGIILEWNLRRETFPVTMKAPSLPTFHQRDRDKIGYGGSHVRSGFTIDIKFKLETLEANQVVLDARGPFGDGWVLETTKDKTLQLTLNDGRTTSVWDCDQGFLQAGKDHHVTIIVDGGPKIIAFVVDGILNDGGEQRQFGWGRFNPYLRTVSGAKDLVIGKNMKGTIKQVAIYNRALTVTEAIGNYRHGQSSGTRALLE